MRRVAGDTRFGGTRTTGAMHISGWLVLCHGCLGTTRTPMPGEDSELQTLWVCRSTPTDPPFDALRESLAEWPQLFFVLKNQSSVEICSVAKPTCSENGPPHYDFPCLFFVLAVLTTDLYPIMFHNDGSNSSPSNSVIEPAVNDSGSSTDISSSPCSNYGSITPHYQ